MIRSNQNFALIKGTLAVTIMILGLYGYASRAFAVAFCDGTVVRQNFGPASGDSGSSDGALADPGGGVGGQGFGDFALPVMAPPGGLGGINPGSPLEPDQLKYADAFGNVGGSSSSVTWDMSASGRDGFRQIGLDSDPVVANTGEYIFQTADLSVGHDGLVFTISRVYRHAAESPHGIKDFGPNFHSNLRVYAKEDDSVSPVEDVIVHLGTGIGIVFHNNGTKWESPIGFERYLFEKIDKGGGKYQYQLTDNNGDLWIFEEENSTTSSPYKLVEKTNRHGEGQEYSYTAGELSSITCNNDMVLSITRNSSDQITEISDSEGREINYEYQTGLSSDRRLVAVDNQCGGCGSATRAAGYGYDGNGNIDSIYNGDNDLIRGIFYDGSDRVDEIDDYYGNTWTFTYDTSTTTMTDPAGYDRMFSFDVDGLITQATFDVSLSPVNSVSFNYTYDKANGNHNLILIENPVGYDVEKEYDSRNRLCVENWINGGPPLKSTTEKTFDGDGKVTALTDPLGKVTNQTFSGQKLTTVEFPGTTGSRSYSYSGANTWYPTTITDASGKVTEQSLCHEANYVEEIIAHEISTGVFTEDHVKRYDFAGRLIYDAPADTAATTISYNDAGDVIERVTDGIISAFTYDNNGNVATKTISEGMTTLESWTYDYDPMGRLLSMENDTVGGATTYTYDSRGNLSVVTDPAGLQTKYTWDGLGRRTRVQQGDGTTWRNLQIVSYDGMGRVTSVLDGEENETEREYDNYGRLAKAIDPDGDYTTYTYDAADRVTEAKRYDASDILLERTVTTYDVDRGWPTEVRRYADADGSSNDATDARTTLAYDDEGRVTNRKVYYSATGYNETSHTYDGVGRMATVTDPEGNVTSYGYDDAGRPTTVTNAAGQVTTTVYDDEGHVEKVTQNDGTYTEYTYDHAGRQTLMITKSASNVALSKTTKSYNEIGQLTETRRWDDPASTTTSLDDHVTTNTYGTTTNTGRLITTTNASGEDTDYTYDSTYGYRTVVTLPDGSTTTYSNFDNNGRAKAVTRVEKTSGQTDKTFVARYTFDNLGRVTTITNQGADGTIGNSDDEVITYTYDERGNRIGVLDASGKLTTTEFDDLGRKVRLIEDDSFDSYTGIARVTEFEYDNAGRMTKMIAYTDSPSSGMQETTYTYDGGGRQTAVTYEVTGTVSMKFDGVGNMTERSDEAGVCVAYTYDADTNRLTERKECNATTDIETFTYDDLGRLLTAEKGTSANPDAISKSTFTYDDLGRVLTEAQSIREGTAKTITYVYDKAGNRTKVTYPDGTVLDFAYDSRDRVNTIDVDSVQMAEYWWRGNTPFAKEITTDYPGATDPVMRTDFVRDHLMRVTQLSTGHLTSNQADTGYDDLLTINYTYDDASNPLTAVDNDSTWNAVSNSYDYDTLNRLVRADLKDTQTWTAASASKHVFNYDDLGNRTTVGDDNALVISAHEASYTHDDANRTTGITTAQTFIGQDTTQTYDAAGNLTETAEIYSEKGYDLEYDYHNRLIAIKNRAGTETVQTFEHDALGRLIESVDGVNERTTRYYYDGVNVVSEYDENDNHLRFYVKGPSYVDELLMMMDVYADRPYYYVLDRMYSVRKLVDRAGAIVESVAYDAYGLARIRLSGGRGDFDLDGDVDSSDVTYHASVVSGSKWNPVGDIDDDGDVDATDATLIADREESWDGDGTLDIDVASAFSRVDNPYYFQGRQRFGNDTAESATDGSTLDNFGSDADMDGDWAVIGAHKDDAAAIDAGSVYVFHYNGSDWEFDVELTASDAATDDVFGGAVAIDGNTIAVGAPMDDDNSAINSGSVYIFVRDANGWSQQAKLTASDYAAGDHFGNSVDLGGDLLVIGSQFWEDGGSGANAGAAYIFRRSGTSWTEEQTLEASDQQALAYFGKHVAIDGECVAVGAPNHDVSGNTDAGHAYVFDYNSGTSSWDEKQVLAASDVDAGALFGRSVSVSGAVVAVGAINADQASPPVTDCGATYIFEKDSGGTDNWGQAHKITASDTGADDDFGSARLDGNRMVITAAGDDDLASQAGACYVFDFNSGTSSWDETEKVTASDGGNSDFFGAKAIDGDRILGVSAWNDDAGSGSGSAYFFDKNLGGTDNWGEDQKIVAIAPLQPAMPTFALNYHRARFMDPVQGTWVSRDPVFYYPLLSNQLSIPQHSFDSSSNQRMNLGGGSIAEGLSLEYTNVFHVLGNSPMMYADPMGTCITFEDCVRTKQLMDAACMTATSQCMTPLVGPVTIEAVACLAACAKGFAGSPPAAGACMVGCGVAGAAIYAAQIIACSGHLNDCLAGSQFTYNACLRAASACSCPYP